jgi:hypothetical protein
MVKVRIRRLLLDAKLKSFVPLASYPADPELKQFLEMEQLHRLNECLVASSRNTVPHMHGVEDLHGGRFWALDMIQTLSGTIIRGTPKTSNLSW